MEGGGEAKAEEGRGRKGKEGGMARRTLVKSLRVDDRG